eukprot:3192630-Rhodomonas_salina.3
MEADPIDLDSFLEILELHLDCAQHTCQIFSPKQSVPEMPAWSKQHRRRLWVCSRSVSNKRSRPEPTLLCPVSAALSMTSSITVSECMHPSAFAQLSSDAPARGGPVLGVFRP